MSLQVCMVPFPPYQCCIYKWKVSSVSALIIGCHFYLSRNNIEREKGVNYKYINYILVVNNCSPVNNNENLEPLHLWKNGAHTCQCSIKYTLYTNNYKILRLCVNPEGAISADL